MNTDRVAKFDPATEQFTEYLLPTRGTEARFISVDNNTNPPAVWVPCYRTNKLARLQLRPATNAATASVTQLKEPKRDRMRVTSKVRPVSRFALSSVGSLCRGASITGTVKGTEGAPFEGAFVEAENTPDAGNRDRAFPQRWAVSD